MATGEAPISGGIAIACGLLLVTTVTVAAIDGLAWSTVLSSFGVFGVTVHNRRAAKKHDREYRERMERLEQRLGRAE